MGRRQAAPTATRAARRNSFQFAPNPPIWVLRMAGWPRASEESPDSTKQWCRVTPGRG